MTMQDQLVQSVDSMGASAGPRAANHLILLARAVLHGDAVEQHDDFTRFITHGDHPFSNAAILPAACSAASVDSAASVLCDLNLPSAIIFEDANVSPDVESVLQERGYVLAETMPAMAIDIDRLTPTSLPDGYTFEQVATGAKADSWTDALAVGYEFPRAVADLFSPQSQGAGLEADATAQCFGVFRDGACVCTSSMYLADGLAGIYCVATVPDERGKGLGAHVTAEPLRRVAPLGYRVGVLQSSAAGHRVYSRLGFMDFGNLCLYARIPG